MVVTQGGGYQMYINQNRDGSAVKTKTSTYRQVAEFMHKRRELYGKLPVAQIGILYSAASRYEEKAEDAYVYNPPHVSDAIKGVLHAVLDARYTADIVLEHQLERLSAYEMVIVPEWKHLPIATEDSLMEYARNGGNLIVIGKDTCLRFGELLKKPDITTLEQRPCCVVDEDDNYYSAFGGCVDLMVGKGTLCEGRDKYHLPCHPLYRIDAYGKGTVSFVAYNLGTCYDFRKSYICADVVHKLLADICPPWFEVSHRNVDVTMQQADEGQYLHVINLNQNRHSMEYIVFDEVPSAQDVKITLHRRVMNVRLPLGEDFSVEYHDNDTVITLKQLYIHTIIQFD